MARRSLNTDEDILAAAAKLRAKGVKPTMSGIYVALGHKGCRYRNWWRYEDLAGLKSSRWPTPTPAMSKPEPASEPPPALGNIENTSEQLPIKLARIEEELAKVTSTLAALTVEIRRLVDGSA